LTLELNAQVTFVLDATTRFSQNFVSVPNKPNDFKLVIRANKLGSINIKIDAIGTLASDALEKPLKVIPEGIPKTITQSIFVVKNVSSSVYSSSLSCVLPPTAVSDTTSASASITGDIMGPMINGLENLIQMSYGCGEQNLLNFVPSLFALRYLEATGQLTNSLRSKAISYAEDGYQRQLTYKHNDGSFSAFGMSDPNGSTWLTAFSVSAFSLASNYISVDSEVIRRAFNFFVGKQNADGSFKEDGNVIHKDMQGGSSGGLAMTAFVSIVLSENLNKFPDFLDARDKALDYIALNVDVTDIYALCISTLALKLGNHASYLTLYNAMIAAGIQTADQMHWSKPVPPPSSSDPWWYYYQPRSVDVEMTSYALKVLADKDIALALKTVKWLVSMKNNFGGYGSTQDTVQALDALSAFTVVFNAAAGTINLRLTPNVGSVINAQVNPSNMLVVQEFTLNPLARQLDIYSGINSTGSAIVTLVCNFYEKSAETAPRFNIRTELIKPCSNILKREVCISYIPKGDDVESNMALVEMTLPSGYVYDNDQKDPAFSSVSHETAFEYLSNLNPYSSLKPVMEEQ
jgi:CD109 antigen